MNNIARAEITSNQALLGTYTIYRKISKELVQDNIPDLLPKKALKKGAKSLGVLKGNTLMLNSEDEMSVFMNYCLFHYYEGSQNAVKKYVSRNLEHLSDAKQSVALAMSNAQFALLVVDKVLPHGGVVVFDILRNKYDLLIDRALNQTAVKGMLLATTILRFPEFIMTTGAAVPIHDVLDHVGELIERFLRKHEDFDSIFPLQQSAFISKLLKICLRENATSGMEYA